MPWVTKRMVFRSSAQIRSSSSCRLRRVRASSAPKGSSISRIGESRRAPGRWRPAGACRRRGPWGSGRGTRRGQELSGARPPSRPMRAFGSPWISSPKAMFCVHRHPGEERVLLEDHGPVGPGPGDRPAVRDRAAGGGQREAGDGVEQRRLSAARTGRAGRRTRRPRRRGRCRSRATHLVARPAAEDLADVLGEDLRKPAVALTGLQAAVPAQQVAASAGSWPCRCRGRMRPMVIIPAMILSDQKNSRASRIR